VGLAEWRGGSDCDVSARKKEPPWYQVSGERLVNAMVSAYEAVAGLANEARVYVALHNRLHRNGVSPTSADEAGHLSKVAAEAAEVGADLDQLADKLTTTEPVAPTTENT
jgi:hypothetical protein